MLYRKCMRSRMLLPLLLALCFCLYMPAHADTYTDPDTGYTVVVEDDADLLSSEQEQLLEQKMRPVTAYGHAVFKSIATNSGSADQYAKDYYYSHFGNSSGVMFLIDMDNRKIYIVSGGAAYRTITTGKANTITDNVYTYASRQDYYGCASKAFEQVNTLLEGGRIAEPMRYIGNGFLALILALIINFIVVNTVSRARRITTSELVQVADSRVELTGPPLAEFTGETKRYDPVERSSGGGGGGFSGGGGGGGGFSGGGGGHSF